jgi:hypothetical protein
MQETCSQGFSATAVIVASAAYSVQQQQPLDSWVQPQHSVCCAATLLHIVHQPRRSSVARLQRQQLLLQRGCRGCCACQAWGCCCCRLGCPSCWVWGCCSQQAGPWSSLQQTETDLRCTGTTFDIRRSCNAAAMLRRQLTPDRTLTALMHSSCLTFTIPEALGRLVVRDLSLEEHSSPFEDGRVSAEAAPADVTACTLSSLSG